MNPLRFPGALRLLPLSFLLVSALMAEEPKQTPAEKFKAMDANGNGKISRAEWKEDGDLFSAMDGDKDGFITQEEARAYLKARSGKGGGKKEKRPLPDGVACERDLVYKKAGGADLALDLYRRKDRAADHAPLLVFIHGGGFVAGNKDAVRLVSGPAAQLLDKGWAVASLDYRLCREGGPRLVDCIVDCKDALRYLVKNAASLKIDTARIAVWGTSAGASLSLLLGLTGDADFPGDPALAGVSTPVRCSVSWFGVTDFTRLELFKDRTRGDEPLTKAAVLFATKPDAADLSEYARCSPVKYLAKDSRPILLAHGDKDPVVPFVQSEWMEKRCKELGAPCEFVRVANAAHGFKKEGGTVEPSHEEIDAKTAAFLLKNTP